MVFHAFQHSHRFGPLLHVFGEFFKVFFSPGTPKNAGFHGVILLTWASSRNILHFLIEAVHNHRANIPIPSLLPVEG
jgi:hypothetical protein